jgi:hypothetical protein
MFPALKAALTWECYKCGHKKTETIPFIKKDMVGLKLEDCQCGQKGGLVSHPRSKEIQRYFL